MRVPLAEGGLHVPLFIKWSYLVAGSSRLSPGVVITSDLMGPFLILCHSNFHGHGCQSPHLSGALGPSGYAACPFDYTNASSTPLKRREKRCTLRSIFALFQNCRSNNRGVCLHVMFNVYLRWETIMTTLYKVVGLVRYWKDIELFLLKGSERFSDWVRNPT